MIPTIVDPRCRGDGWTALLRVMIGVLLSQSVWTTQTLAQEGEDGGRSFLFKEVVLSGFVSFDGVTGLPRGDNTDDYVELSPRPPGNYVGLDYVRTFTEESRVNRWLPDWLPLQTMTLHPRLVWDRTERDECLYPLKFAPQDFWVRFNPWGKDRLSLRLGQFVIPFGSNPILAPRQRIQLPIEATDLGLKWDWGIDLKGPAGEYDWEVAATLANGVGLHSPGFLEDKDHRRFLFTGRIGSPTYWDFQHGVSFLLGDAPPLRGPRILARQSISRWRVGYDVFWHHGLYLMTGAQLTYGQDGFAGNKQATTVTGSRLWADWILPDNEDLRLSGQFEWVRRDIVSAAFDMTDDMAVVLEVSYSLTTAISAVSAYRQEIRRSMGDRNDALYLSLVYYAR